LGGSPVDGIPLMYISTAFMLGQVAEQRGRPRKRSAFVAWRRSRGGYAHARLLRAAVGTTAPAQSNDSVSSGAFQ
jgi:hypothetical protein